MNRDYVHGYEDAETRRLEDSARTLDGVVHAGTIYPAGSLVLEAGCGVGAQTLRLARNSPGARLTSIDLSRASLDRARKTATAAGLRDVLFLQADIFALPFEDEAFDHVFVCFVLEHASDPLGALSALKRVLRPGGTITVVEGDHGSILFHPDDAAARSAIRCQVELQRASGGDACIGRRLLPLLREAGFDAVAVSPRMVYVDANRPDLVEGFTRKTFTAMIAGVAERAIAAGLVDPATFAAGLRGLYRTTEADGVFCYTFFKALGRKRA